MYLKFIKMSVFKIKHIPSGLFWKGGGMRKNNGGSNILYKRKTSKFYGKTLNPKDPEMALEICFSKTGKVWNKEAWATVAKNYGHEPGLDMVLKDCEIVEYTLTN